MKWKYAKGERLDWLFGFTETQAHGRKISVGPERSFAVTVLGRSFCISWFSGKWEDRIEA